MITLARRFVISAVPAVAGLALFWAIMATVASQQWPDWFGCPDSLVCDNTAWERGLLAANYYAQGILFLGTPIFLLGWVLFAGWRGAGPTFGGVLATIASCIAVVVSNLIAGLIDPGNTVEWEIVTSFDGISLAVAVIAFGGVTVLAGLLARKGADKAP